MKKRFLIGLLYTLVGSFCVYGFTYYFTSEKLDPFYGVVLCLLGSYILFSVAKWWTNKADVHPVLCRIFEFVTLVLIYLLCVVVMLMIVKDGTKMAILETMGLLLVLILSLMGVVR